MPDYPELFVLRHGQTEWNVEGRYQGHQDSPLTPLGLKQADTQGHILKEILGGQTLPSFCSPQLRAKRTAEIALTHIGQVAKPDDRLKEVGFGQWEGRTRAEIAENTPDLPSTDEYLRLSSAPDGEGFEAVKIRCESFLSVLTAPTLIVSHGITTSVLRGLWLGLSAPEMIALPKAQGCVYHLSHGVEHCLTQ